MDAERARAFLLQLPHVVETLQWGDNLVFWVGDKAVGGKMFALMDLEGHHGLVVSFAAGAEHAAELLELEGMRPAPYLARAHWVAAERWDALSEPAWEQALTNAHASVLDKLPRATRTTLELPPRAYRAAVAARRRELAAKEKKS